MDEFGVLTERYGLKSQKKSAPMAASKRQSTITTTTNNFGSNSNLNPKSTWNPNSVNGSFVDNQDFLFPNKKTQTFDDYGDIFGDFQKGSTTTTKQWSGNNSSSINGFDYDSIFPSSGSKSSSMNLYDNDDIFGLKSSNPVKDDIFGSFTASQVDDLFGSSQNGSAKPGFDDLIPGFGSTSPRINGEKVKTAISSFTSIEDPFVVLESTSNVANTSFIDPLEEISKLSGGKKPGSSSTVTPPLRPPPKPAQVLKADKVKSSSVSPIDELEDFAMGRVRNNADAHLKERQSTKASRYKEAEDAPLESQQKGADDLESFFGMGSRSSSVPRSRATTLDPAFDAKIHDRRGPQVANRTTSGASSTASPATNMVDDLSFIFGAAPLFGEFDEVEGESEERRKARLGRHLRTENRVAQAVADMNQRDRQTQHEQEERRRIADTLDFEIKRWAAGKEGNMRALLSSLQQVLWPECGWEPVSLTDLITSTSVKKVYRKATLYVHPDKVQQKGATLQQKYIAEKVFDILKEAWNKFNSEELS